MKTLKAMIQRDKNQLYSPANLGGLAVGLIVAIFIALWAVEKSYDYGFKDFDQSQPRLYNAGRQQEYSASDQRPESVEKVLLEEFAPLDSLLRIAHFVERSMVDMFSLKVFTRTADASPGPQATVTSEFTAEAKVRCQSPINQVRLNTVEVSFSGSYLDILPTAGMNIEHRIMNSE